MTDDDLTRKSWDLCRAIGAEKFFISDGLPASEYHAAYADWREAFERHPQYEDFQADDGRQEVVRQRIIADIGITPVLRRRAIELTESLYPDELADLDGIPETHRHPGMVYAQDGDPILAMDGEVLLSVSLWSRWYGVGYERGDLLTICAVAEWLEINMAPCEVWYGGDSSGVLAEPFPESRRLELRRHLYSQAGRDYYQHERTGTFPTPKPCGLCVPGENRFNRHGFGQSYVAVNCAGCGRCFASRDGGNTWAEEKRS